MDATEPRPVFNMDCGKCEYEPVCWIPLRVANKLSHRWFQFCRQGRKRKVIRQQTIAEVLVQFEQKKAEVMA